MNGYELMSGGKSSAMPPAQCLDIRQAIETMTMSSGRRLLNTPAIHVSVLATYAGALIGAGAGIGPVWSAALAWNILPAALGNTLGGFLLVVVPFSICFGSKHSAMKEGKQDFPHV